MKFYYNDKLIRTSKTHHYTHAVINENGEALTCSATLKGCESFINAWINGLYTSIQNATNAINAIKNGKTTYKETFCGRVYNTPIKGSVEQYEEWIQKCKTDIKRYQTCWQIVELEERA